MDNAGSWEEANQDLLREALEFPLVVGPRHVAFDHDLAMKMYGDRVEYLGSNVDI